MFKHRREPTLTLVVWPSVATAPAASQGSSVGRNPDLPGAPRPPSCGGRAPVRPQPGARLGSPGAGEGGADRSGLARPPPGRGVRQPHSARRGDGPCRRGGLRGAAQAGRASDRDRFRPLDRLLLRGAGRRSRLGGVESRPRQRTAACRREHGRSPGAHQRLARIRPGPTSR